MNTGCFYIQSSYHMKSLNVGRTTICLEKEYFDISFNIYSTIQFIRIETKGAGQDRCWQKPLRWQVMAGKTWTRAPSAGDNAEIYRPLSPRERLRHRCFVLDIKKNNHNYWHSLNVFSNISIKNASPKCELKINYIVPLFTLWSFKH